ncbi:MAG: MCE family protein [Verrucomicrobia bacterium]|nr:MCE family protein [Verrucomicrobiota bacterium]
MDEPTEIPQQSSSNDPGKQRETLRERFRFRHVHGITGTFVLVIVGVLIIALALAGRSQRWFMGNVTLRIILPEAGAAGIRQGSEVYFLGTLMGTVWDVSVDPDGRMEAQVNIRRDFFLFVRDDSSAVVKKRFGMVGDAYFEITRGHGLPLPEKNASIICNEQLPSALESAVEEIRSEAVPALKKLSSGLDTWTTLGSNMITTQERLDQLLTRADNIGADLQAGNGTVGRFLTDSSIADELETLLVKANQSMDELQVTFHNLQLASSSLQLASTNLPGISEALGNEAKDLPGLVLQTQNSMRELERLVEGMQRHWFLRKYVNSTNVPAGRR